MSDLGGHLELSWAVLAPSLPKTDAPTIRETPPPGPGGGGRGRGKPFPEGEEGPKMAPKWPQDGPKMASRWPQDSSRWPCGQARLSPHCGTPSSVALKLPEMTQYLPQKSHNKSQDNPKTDPKWPDLPPRISALPYHLVTLVALSPISYGPKMAPRYLVVYHAIGISGR